VVAEVEGVVLGRAPGDPGLEHQVPVRPGDETEYRRRRPGQDPAAALRQVAQRLDPVGEAALRRAVAVQEGIELGGEQARPAGDATASRSAILLEREQQVGAASMRIAISAMARNSPRGQQLAEGAGASSAPIPAGRVLGGRARRPGRLSSAKPYG
jgi:hypothetical protein